MSSSSFRPKSSNIAKNLCQNAFSLRQIFEPQERAGKEVPFKLKTVIPAQAGIQWFSRDRLDSRLRGNDTIH
jgi:hypothetical protein